MKVEILESALADLEDGFDCHQEISRGGAETQNIVPADV